MDDTKVSRFISLVLRHNPSAANVVVDHYGWVDVDSLLIGLCNKGYNVTREDLDRIVAEDTKGRYSYSADGVKIRANQGHSIDVDLQFQTVIPPIVLYHGTGKKYLQSILKDGIDKRSRQYVHLSDNLDTAVNVGERHGEVVVLSIDTEQMVLDGYVFYRSENNVWLTDFVAPKYIKVWQ